MRQTTLTEQRRPLIKSACAKLTSTVAKWIAKSCRPINIVEDEGVRRSFESGNGGLEHQSNEKTHNNDKSTSCMKLKRKKRKITATKHQALTGDHWTYVSHDNYLGVTAHLITDEWKLKSFTLTCMKTEERHFAEACAEQFQTVASNWAIEDKTTTIGKDSARNMINAARLL